MSTTPIIALIINPPISTKSPNAAVKSPDIILPRKSNILPNISATCRNSSLIPSINAGIVVSARKLNNAFKQIGDEIATGITDALVGAIQGTKSLGEAARSIINDLATSLLRLGINTLLGNVFGIGIFGGGRSSSGAVTRPLMTAANGGFIPGGRP